MAPDLVNGVLNWVGTPAMVASLLLFYPPYYLFKTCYSFLSWLFPEDLAGKVVLITGASSGIGEVRWHTCTTQYCLSYPALRLLLSLTDHIQIRFSSSLTDLSMQQLAYQYALNRASLALVARRESSLRHVADRALELGARDVVVLPGDVSAPDDCDRFVRTAISHYDRCECMRSTPSIP